MTLGGSRLAMLLVALLALLGAATTTVNPTIQLRKCVNLQSSYAGSWLASAELFKRCKWVDRMALEFATRDLFNLAHGLKGSGYKTNGKSKFADGRDPDLRDFMVLHLSGIEHALVRKHGYAKGLALTNRTTATVFDAVLARHQIEEEEEGGGTREREGKSPGAGLFTRSRRARVELMRRAVGLVPFYGGVAAVDVDGKGRVVNTTLPAGAGNSHTLATTEMKVLQLAAVVASVQSYVGTVVVGVVSPAEAAIVSEGLRRLLPAPLLAAARLRLQVGLPPEGGWTL